MKDVPITVKNWAAVGIMALTFILVAKLVLTKYPVKGLTPVVLSA